MVSSLAQLLDQSSRELLDSLDNSDVTDQLDGFIRLCKPSAVFVLGDTKEDLRYVRDLALKNGEEEPLRIKGHTIHFDSSSDLARDVKSTKVLTPSGMNLSKGINAIDRDQGLAEILGLLDGSMLGKNMFAKFYCLGPNNSRFSLSAMQVTDSAYVLHSEDLLYHQGYRQFKKLRRGGNFFTFLHSAGQLDQRGVTKNPDKRRIYVDVMDGKVYSVNNQYAGNSAGLKKLALRLAIYKANHEDWLAEHMFIMGVHPPGKDRVTYFTGAYPSSCGKTSTAMIPGETIVGDDIAYLRQDREGNCRAVNIEKGIFGIIQDINPVDDSLIYKALKTPRELVFSNMLIANGRPYWIGMGAEEIPEKGTNFSGDWWKGKKDADGKEIPFAHANARYTMRLNELDNVDPKYEDRQGVVVKGIFYGGRDSDTNVPVMEALNWEHGVYLGVVLESETTSATIGETGIRKLDPMANRDFVVVPLGTYFANHLKFGERLKNRPRIFTTNYFLKNNGNYTNTKLDKKIWVLWAEGRIHGDYRAITTPIGYIPQYDDLRNLFDRVFNRSYSEADYVVQFSIRLENYLKKITRMEEFYGNEPDIPEDFWTVLHKQKADIQELRERTGKDALPPSYFE